MCSWIINKNTNEQGWQDQSLRKLGLIYIPSENYIIIRWQNEIKWAIFTLNFNKDTKICIQTIEPKK